MRTVPAREHEPVGSPHCPTDATCSVPMSVTGSLKPQRHTEVGALGNVLDAKCEHVGRMSPLQRAACHPRKLPEQVLLRERREDKLTAVQGQGRARGLTVRGPV